MEIKIEKIIRTKRKTIALQITDDAKLIVRAPLKVSNDDIMLIIAKHEKWIKKKKTLVESRDPKFSPKEFVNGEGFLFMGRYYKLEIVENQNEPLIWNNRFYLSSYYVNAAKKFFVQWYKKMAKEKISERVQFYANLFGYKYNKINITNAQKRWGSCTSKGNLNFSWRLVMAPLSVIDFVVIHELAHLEEKNHTKKFWNKIKSMLPNYETHMNWLKNNGHMLRL